jgi:hypothetical protein
MRHRAPIDQLLGAKQFAIRCERVRTCARHFGGAEVAC